MTELRLTGIFPDATAAGEALRAARLTLAVAESCTGGLLGAALTAVPGSSDYMRGGVIAYSDETKVDLLSVPPETITRCGAVSEEVALAMADGARERCGADVGVAITGVAGPGGGTRNKPVGLILVCVTGPSGALVERLDGDHGREPNRNRAVETALRLCIAAAGR